MNIASKHLLGVSLLCCALAPAGAVTLTDISFTSNGGAFINDTIVNGTSPLAFTATTNLSQPFLNAADSTLSLGYGNYYAIAFLGFGQHQGPGIISFRVDGGAVPVAQSVTFPDPSMSSGVFANFALPGGDSVTVAATGLSADRIRIVADGGGLQADGTADAFYAFNYTSGVSAVPEPVTTMMFASGLAVLGLLSKRRRR